MRGRWHWRNKLRSDQFETPKKTPQQVLDEGKNMAKGESAIRRLNERQKQHKQEHTTGSKAVMPSNAPVADPQSRKTYRILYTWKVTKPIALSATQRLEAKLNELEGDGYGDIRIQITPKGNAVLIGRKWLGSEAK